MEWGHARYDLLASKNFLRRLRNMRMQYGILLSQMGRAAVGVILWCDTEGDQPGLPGARESPGMRDFQSKMGKVPVKLGWIVTLCDNNILWTSVVNNSSGKCFQVFLVVDRRDLNDYMTLIVSYVYIKLWEIGTMATNICPLSKNVATSLRRMVTCGGE